MSLWFSMGRIEEGRNKLQDQLLAPKDTQKKDSTFSRTFIGIHASSSSSHPTGDPFLILLLFMCETKKVERERIAKLWRRSHHSKVIKCYAPFKLSYFSGFFFCPHPSGIDLNFWEVPILTGSKSQSSAPDLRRLGLKIKKTKSSLRKSIIAIILNAKIGFRKIAAFRIVFKKGALIWVDGWMEDWCLEGRTFSTYYRTLNGSVRLVACPSEMRWLHLH